MTEFIGYAGFALAALALAISLAARFYPYVAAKVTKVEAEIKAIEPEAALKIAAEAKALAEAAVVRVEAEAAAAATLATKSRAALTAFKAAA